MMSPLGYLDIDDVISMSDECMLASVAHDFGRTREGASALLKKPLLRDERLVSFDVLMQISFKLDLPTDVDRINGVLVLKMLLKLLLENIERTIE